MENHFKKRKTTYDLNYLTANDLCAKPSVERLTIQIPQLKNDESLLTALYATDPDMPPEVAEYFKTRAARLREKENAAYAAAAAQMRTVSITWDDPIDSISSEESCICGRKLETTDGCQLYPTCAGDVDKEC